MACVRLARWLLNRANARGAREALVGDLLEEMARGRSGLWACEQLFGFYRVALVAHLQDHARITPLLVALMLGVLLVGAVSVAPLEHVLETWMSVYYLAGAMTLFAHVMSRTIASRAPLFTDEVGSDSATNS